MRLLCVVWCAASGPAWAGPVRVEVYDHAALQLSEWGRPLDARCRPGESPTGCREALPILASYAWFRLVTSDLVEPLEPVAPTPTCGPDVLGCLAARYGDGLWYVRSNDAVWFAPIGEGEVRAVWFRQPGIGRQRDSLVAPGAVYRQRVLRDPVLASAIGRRQPVEVVYGFESEVPITGFVDDLVGWNREAPRDRFRWAEPLRGPARVVCPDRVAEVGPGDLVAVSSVLYPLLDVVGVDYTYALPCPGRLVLGSEVPGVSVGPWAGATPWTRPKPSPDGLLTRVAGAVTFTGRPPMVGTTERWSDCTVQLGDGPVFRTRRRCAVPFVGDLNGDGLEDAAIWFDGEMGCAGTALWMSGGVGWTAVARSWNVC